jgi:hypothetical protein
MSLETADDVTSSYLEEAVDFANGIESALYGLEESGHHADRAMRSGIRALIRAHIRQLELIRDRVVAAENGKVAP